MTKLLINGTVKEITIEIHKRGRKYFKVSYPNSDFQFDMVINPNSQHCNVGETITILCDVEKAITKYGTKIKATPIDLEAYQEVEKQREINEEISRWSEYVKSAFDEGRIYERGLYELQRLGVDTNALYGNRIQKINQHKKEVEAAREKALRERKTKKYRRILMPEAFGTPLDEPLEWNGKTIVVTGTGKSFVIDEDKPSYEGSHLLGYEGDSCCYHYYEDSNENPKYRLSGSGIWEPI